MPVEVCNYRLSLRGAPVGTHTLRSEQRGQVVHLEGRLTLRGSLGQLTTVQTSRTHRRRHFSLGFREETNRRGENRVYDVAFDQRTGLVRAVRGKDEASVPYFRPYRDPLGMLREVRTLGTDQPEVRIPMLGKDVVVRFLGEVELKTILGSRSAWAYELLPGRSLVWVDDREPHAILQMTQWVDGQLVEVQLQELTHEEPAPASAQAPKEKRGRRRRRRRRR